MALRLLAWLFPRRAPAVGLCALFALTTGEFDLTATPLPAVFGADTAADVEGERPGVDILHAGTLALAAPSRGWTLAVDLGGNPHRRLCSSDLERGRAPPLPA